MAPFVLVSLAICFSVGPILSSTLTYIDTSSLFRAEARISEYNYRWEKIARIVFDIFSIGLGITGLVAIATEPHPAETYSWLDAVIMCNLQLLASNNLARTLQIFISPPWIIWAVHLVTVLTILDIASAVTGKIVSSAYESALLTRFAAASLFSSALSHKQLGIHKNSGSEHRDKEYMRLLHTFIFTNAAAASSQFCGALFISSFSLADRSTSTKLRQGVFMLLCHLPFYINRIRRRIILPIGDWTRRLRHSFAWRLADESNL
ncbi:hypothetical protein COCMIDRAFT_40856 [Bipolaris oryzae ATCC 44560]|uniref:Uncharacterized protein n=1 Tax=Bipolaris oryzae ATCC 44560 TaxID=930090 RepID=W6YTF0_COCMI|nr:uncharacterized protein COCMIDRAFT_40856 [Bipolaris oryzae ATCC 44560]EUC40875.1 hypothetical protein COCMIDRAFT_40856 [Bipolaris oryzae ATCC 44560]